MNKINKNVHKNYKLNEEKVFLIMSQPTLNGLGGTRKLLDNILSTTDENKEI